MTKAQSVAEAAHHLAVTIAFLGVVALFMAGIAGHETPNAVAAGLVLVKIGAGLFGLAAILKAVSVGAWLYTRAGDDTRGV